MATTAKEPHVVIVGGGFGGLNAAKAFRKAPVRVTLIDRTNHHLFQPLLYQVATASLSPADIAVPIRSVFSRQRNVRVLLGDVKRVDLAEKRIEVDDDTLDYDYLILAVGATNNYFGHDEWARFAPALKSLDEALTIRERMLLAFEAAEREDDPAVRRRLLTFVVIGGGATGVEMAGAFAELARYILERDFRALDPASSRVLLVEIGPRILQAFPESLSASAEQQLTSLGVEVIKGRRFRSIDEQGVEFEDGERLPAATVIWAAGVRGTPLARTLGVELDRIGRVKVAPDCSVPGHPNVFAIGDMAALRDRNGVDVPGLSPAAIQEGRFVARCILDDLKGKPRGQFAYLDKGTMATIGRSRAIAKIGRLKMSGMIAWLAWLLVHVLFLIDYKNRLAVMFSWMWQYITFKRGARLITGHTAPSALPATAEAAASLRAPRLPAPIAAVDAPSGSAERSPASLA
ncbi:NADH dehydrogenase [Sorangium cellulosum]|uniref:NADH:ubiquinone reductase (non-electrogenic) n=1 Tax=Sorangium cellulosum TaxID=56 RepID=A0A2L0EIV2_SORCE|nr:NAD(P)/FAD-dependent oxidoreductase [Sorangium cellulosum]AUX39207.1 NADH dehydrogenase [Sorangium cellulosum]